MTKARVPGAAWALALASVAGCPSSTAPPPAGAAPMCQSRAATLETGALDVHAFGAVGDGTTNDGPAVQAAVNKAATAGGVVLFPPGNYLIATPVYLETSGDSQSFALRGYGSASQILCETGPTHICLTLQQDSSHACQIGLEDLVIRRATTSKPGKLHDSTVLKMSNAWSEAYLRHVQFYGLTTASHLVWIHAGTAIVDSVSMYGCAAHNFSANLFFDQVVDAHVLHFRGADYGTLGNVTYSADGGAYLGIWAMAPEANPPAYVDPIAYFHWEDGWLDEGQGNVSIQIGPDETTSSQRRFDRVVIDGVYSNVPSPDNSVAVRVRKAERVTIKNFNGSWSRRPKPWLALEDAGDVVVEHCTIESGYPSASQITIDQKLAATTRSVRIVDSKVTVVASAARGPVLWERSGVLAQLRAADGAVAAGTLVVQSADTDGRVVAAGAGAVPSQILGVALDAAAGAGELVAVAQQHGQVVEIKSDGRPITRGDAVGPSTVVAGRIGAVGPGPLLGRALESAPAAPDTPVRVLYAPGQM